MAGFEGQLNPDDGEHPGGDVGDGMAGADALPAFYAGDGDETAGGLDDEVHGGVVAGGSGLAIARNRAINESRVARADGFVAEAEPRHGAGAHVFDKNVGLGGEVERERKSSGVLQIDGEAALAGVEAEEIRRLAG